MLKILFVLNTFPGLGGVETVTVNLIEALGSDNDIYVAAFHKMQGFELPGKVKKAFYLKDGMTESNIVSYNDFVSEYGITHVINQGMYYFLSDIVLNPWRNPNVKVISVLHGMPGYEKKEYWCQDHIKNAGVFKALSKKILGKFGVNRKYNRYLQKFAAGFSLAARKSDVSVLLCKEYIRKFARLYVKDAGKVNFVAIQNPLSRYYSGQPEPDMNKKENIILYVGRLSEEKNILDILKAWRRLQRTLDGWRLQIVGDGPVRSKLEEYARKMSGVEFTGYIHDPLVYYGKAKILLLTSRFEGYPMALIEAQRFGVVPVAYPSSDGVVSILKDEGGIMVPEKTPKALAEAVECLASDCRRMEQLSFSAYRKSDSNTITAVAGKWRELLGSL